MPSAFTPCCSGFCCGCCGGAASSPSISASTADSPTFWIVMRRSAFSLRSIRKPIASRFVCTSRSRRQTQFGSFGQCLRVYRGHLYIHRSPSLYFSPDLLIHYTNNPMIYHVDLTGCTCNLCGHHWISRLLEGLPRRCPGCKRTDWNHMVAPEPQKPLDIPPSI